jgi:2-methylcitrate dehydratase
MMGNDPSRWAPTTHETADHSLPYTVAIAFLDGAVTESSFEHARFTDPQVVAMMQKVKVAEDPALSALYPDGAPGRLTVTMDSGEVETAEMRYPTGHAKSSIGDAEVEKKFYGMLEKRIPRAAGAEALGRLWQLEQARDVGAEVLDRLAS